MRRAVAVGCVASILVFAVSVFAVPGHAATAAFEPFRASFVSSTTGFVLGTEGCSLKLVENPVAQRRCSAAVLATTDGGAHWRGVSAPATILSPDQVQVSRVRGRVVVSPFVGAIVFADARNGWLYGPGLWSTHDGGVHWTRIALDKPVYAVTAAGGSAYAMTTATSNAVLREPLLRSPVGRDDWQPVASVTADADAATMPNAAFGSTAWVATGVSKSASTAARLWRTTDGSNWQSLGYPCGRQNQIVSMAASSAASLAISCGPSGVVYTSSDSGVRVQRAPGLMGEGGITGQIATPPGSPSVIVSIYPSSLSQLAFTTINQSTVLRSTDGGRSIKPSVYHDRGAGFIDLQFVSQTAGWIVHGYPGGPVDQLMRTADAGATFVPVVP